MDKARLDKWAFVISLLAFAISGATLWYSRKQVVLTTGQVKAYVQVTEAKLIEPISEASFVKVQLKLKNFGQTAATNVHGDMDYKDNSPNLTRESNYATLLRFGSMGPGLERSVILTSNRRSRREWPVPSLRGDQSVFFFGTVWYTDDTSGEERKEDWCYLLVLKTADDLKRTELEPCARLRFESGKDPLSDR
jgi:hypothetical protein